MEKLFGKSLRSKKGDLYDIIMIGVILLFFSMILLIGYKISDSFRENILANDEMAADANIVESTNTLVGYYPTVLDGSFLFLAIGLAIVSLILASLVRVHPVFFVPFLIGWIFIVILSGIFADVYMEMAGSDVLAIYANNLVFTTFIMKYLPLIVGILGMILAAVMYKLWSNGEQ